MKKIILMLVVMTSSMFVCAQSSSESITPIKAKKTTDPNYEINLMKSEEVRKRNAQPKKVIVKDSAYYTEKILFVEKQIAAAKEDEMNGIDRPKLPSYIDELGRLIKAKKAL
jgi:hypothetical protein